MCLLVVCSPDSTPKKKDLECASCNNPHGFGYAVITPNGIVTGRSMSSKKLIREFLAVRKEFPNSWAMFHARYATHGVKNEENCHPFKVPSNPNTYLAHNGILDIAIKAGDKRSDTRIFAEDTLPAMGGVTALDDDHVWKMVSKWSLGSKIVVFTLDPNAKEQCYIINEDAGHWDNEGMWWSNNGYKPSTASSWSSFIDYDKDTKKYEPINEVVGEDIYECSSCQAVAYEDANPYYCEMCYTCWDCNGVYGDSCLCFTPSATRYDYAKKSSQGKGWYYDKYFDFGK
jgi:glutamine amidotransferase